MIDFDMKSVSGRKGKQEGGIKKIERKNFFTKQPSKAQKIAVRLKLPPKWGQKRGLKHNSIHFLLSRG
jgi:hypothetical protein